MASPARLDQAPGGTPASAGPARPATARLRWRRIPRRGRAALVVLAVFVLAGSIGPVLRPYNPVQVRLGDRLLGPWAHLSNGSITPLGTDQLGRDMLAEILAGSRVSLIVGLATVLIAGAIGLALGLAAGYSGGWLDSLISRLGDIQLAFPSVLLAILIAGVLGPSLLNVIIALAVTRWVIFARVARASALTAVKQDYVASARVLGAGHRRIMLRYILPSCWGSLLVTATAQIGLATVAEASLSFLGLGVPVTEASWGSTIANGQDYIATAWWIAAEPGIALAIVVVCVGLIADIGRDLLEPGSAP
jgi:peptide/nickel transport system permease protein